MSEFILPIIAGAVSYAAAQFLWYGPFAFGSSALRSDGISEDVAVEAALSDANRQSRVYFGIIIPAILISTALVALRVIADRWLGTAAGFLLLSFLLWFGVSMPKYLAALVSGRGLERRLLIQDGALLFGLLGSAFAIIGSTV